MVRRLVLIALLALVAQWGAFRVVYRDLLWLDAQAASHPSAGEIRASAASVLQRPRPTRRHLEALIRLTDRGDLRDLQAAALERLAAREPDDPAVQLRLAEALRLAGRFEESARVFTRVAEAR